MFPPIPREARNLLRFIKSLEKEDDSLYRFRLLILVYMQFPPPTPYHAKRGSFAVSLNY